MHAAWFLIPVTVPPTPNIQKETEHGCIQEGLPPVFEEVIEEPVPELVKQAFLIKEAFLQQQEREASRRFEEARRVEELEEDDFRAEERKEGDRSS